MKRGGSMASISSAKEMKEQYSSDANLHSRIQIKRLFSTGHLSWADFLLQEFQLKSNQHILELGCGNGIFWRAVSNRIPQNIRLVLSDMSSGMLDVAKNNTNGFAFIEEYAEIDVQKIPYNNDTFDIVIANYMLYHVPDIDMALSEISRVLKHDGFFYAATFGKNNLMEVDDTFKKFDDSADSVIDTISRTFGLENGANYLRNYFNSVKLKRYENSLHVTELNHLVEYFLSYRGMGNISSIILDDKIPQFIDFLAELFKKEHYFDITQDEGLFISYNPKK